MKKKKGEGVKPSRTGKTLPLLIGGKVYKRIVKHPERYGRVKVAGKDAYARKFRVVDELKGKARTYPVRDRKSIIWNPASRQWVKYNPSLTTTIRTKEGTELVSYEQLRYIYTRKKGIYQPKVVEGHAISSFRYAEKARRGMMPPLTQAITTLKALINGKKVVVEGFSHFSKASKRLSYDEMRRESYAKARNQLRYKEKESHTRGRLLSSTTRVSRLVFRQ